MVPLGNFTSFYIDFYNASLLVVLSHTAQLANLFVRLEPDKASQDRAWMWDGALVPPVAALCTVLSRSEHVECSSFLEWPRYPLIQPNDLGVPDIVLMLSTRAGLGHPIRCLVVQAIPLSDSDLESRSALQSYFSDQLSPLAEHVERFEECVDGDMHMCAFEMWNLPGTEDYWCVDKKQTAQYTPLWSYDYSFC